MNLAEQYTKLLTHAVEGGIVSSSMATGRATQSLINAVLAQGMFDTLRGIPTIVRPKVSRLGLLEATSSVSGRPLRADCVTRFAPHTAEKFLTDRRYLYYEPVSRGLQRVIDSAKVVGDRQGALSLNGPTDARMRCISLFTAMRNSEHRLDVTVVSRSSDLVLGHNVDLDHLLFLAATVADAVGVTAVFFTWIGVNAHVYVSHLQRAAALVNSGEVLNATWDATHHRALRDKMRFASPLDDVCDDIARIERTVDDE